MDVRNITQSDRFDLIGVYWQDHAMQHQLQYNVVQAPNYPFQIMMETLGWVTSSPLTDGTNGVAYSQTVVASGGTGSYTYAQTAGTAPTGLTVNSNGTITGTPTVPGVYTFTVTATDTGGNSGSKVFQITINTSGPAGTLQYSSSLRSASSLHIGL